VLFNEPKLLKSSHPNRSRCGETRFSALQRAEIAEMMQYVIATLYVLVVSVLFNEPKLLKYALPDSDLRARRRGFSALQRAEIAEIRCTARW